jgi:hypothetical protein
MRLNERCKIGVIPTMIAMGSSNSEDARSEEPRKS